MRPNLVIWKVTLALLFAGSLPFAHATPVACEVLLRAALTHEASVEKAILDSVTPDAVRVDEIKKLASAVFQLTLSDGNSVVLRMATNEASPAFEDFAARFVREAPGLGTPLVRKLTGAEVRKYIPLLRRAGFEPGVRLHETTDGQTMASLAVFFPMTVGKRYVADAAGMELRAELQDLLEGYVGFGNDLEAQRAWSEAEPEIRAAVAEDVSRLVPELKPERVSPTSIKALAERLGKEKISNALDSLGLLGWRRLPKTVREQLAAYWAMYTALGIPDFHPKNWLVHAGVEGDLVLAIDLALKSRDFVAGEKELELVNHQSPHDGSRVSPAMYRALISELTPELLGFLRGLRRADLARIARDAGFEVKDAELTGMLGRIQAILSHRP